MTKDELRAALAREEQRYKDVYGGEVTLYAAQPEPDRKPWRKRASVQDKAFEREVRKIEEERLKACAKADEREKNQTKTTGQAELTKGK